MKNTRWFVVWDFETDGKDPESEDTNPVQLAAVPVDPDTLQVRKEQMFNQIIKPVGIDTEEYFTDERRDTIQWHADHLGLTSDEIVERWKNGVDPKVAWKGFCKWCTRYHVDKRPGQWYPEPIGVGYNIIGYDWKIAERLCKKYKTEFPFSIVNKVDMMDVIFVWFENLDEPFDRKLDTLREFLGIKLPGGKAHDATTDVLEEAALFVKFMQFHRRQASVGKFQGSFEKVQI